MNPVIIYVARHTYRCPQSVHTLPWRVGSVGGRCPSRRGALGLGTVVDVLIRITGLADQPLPTPGHFAGDTALTIYCILPIRDGCSWAWDRLRHPSSRTAMTHPTTAAPTSTAYSLQFGLPAYALDPDLHPHVYLTPRSRYTRRNSALITIAQPSLPTLARFRPQKPVFWSTIMVGDSESWLKLHWRWVPLALEHSGSSTKLHIHFDCTGPAGDGQLLPR
ncbi:hypothetical protein B0H16DRAFT_1762692 [Mycena metata]|uniref:Uncharacterized protein n=1 Tax=Mycena metata TaxID=1033252 RepID=A0AAD7I8D8_9AGAR|nr:hypothetical protein B0H16DRAFT_1762692 [Mycena metata]